MGWFSRSHDRVPASESDLPPAGLRRMAWTGAPTVSSEAASTPATATGSGLAAADVMSSFVELSAQLGEFQRLLTVGEGAVYPIAPALADQLVALDMGARQAVIICIETSDASLAQQVRQLTARLKAEGYTVGAPRLATREAIADVLRNPGQRLSGAGSGPLALFLSWIEIAEGHGATDVHVEIRGSTAQVRVRVDGSLEPLADAVAGRYSAKEAHDAIAAGYNSTRKGSNSPTYEEDKFLDCMIGFNTARASGQLRFQNLRGRLGPKAVIRLLRQDRLTDRAERLAASGPHVAGGQP